MNLYSSNHARRGGYAKTFRGVGERLIGLALIALFIWAASAVVAPAGACASGRTKTLPGGQVVPINEVLYPHDARMPSSGGVSLEMMESAWKRLSAVTGFDAFVWYQDEDTINAYITKDKDGDFMVVVFRGLLDILRTEDEIAGVLGHEIGHGVNGHLEKARGQATGVVVAASVLSHILGAGKLGDAAIGVGANLAVQGYSREHEVEADDFAVEYAFKAGYSPWSIYDSILRMADAGQVTPPSGFNSHPPTERRMTRLRNQAERWEKEGRGGQSQVAKTPGAADGVANDSLSSPKTEQPEARDASASKIAGFNPNTSEDIKVITTYPISPGEQNSLSILHRNGSGNFSAGRYKDALAAFSRAADSFDGDYLNAYWAGKTALKMGKKKEAAAWLDRALAINPDYEPAKKLSGR